MEPPAPGNLVPDPTLTRPARSSATLYSTALQLDFCPFWRVPELGLTRKNAGIVERRTFGAQARPEEFFNTPVRPGASKKSRPLDFPAFFASCSPREKG